MSENFSESSGHNGRDEDILLVTGDPQEVPS